MAKSDSFYVRASTNFDGTNFAQSAIDLGAYVDALGKTVLRVHNIAVTYGKPQATPAATATQNHSAQFQLTTQSQSAIVDATDKSVISTGKLAISAGGAGETVMMSQDLDIAPQHWRNGYLVGVEQIYLGVDQTMALFSGSDNPVCVVLECTVETLTQNAAMALALSQQ